MGGAFYMIAGGKMYQGYHKRLDDREMFSRLFERFEGTKKDATYNIAQGFVAVSWNECTDIAVPFGDRRQCHYETCWTFDVEKDELHFLKPDTAGRVLLDVVRQRRITFADFEAEAVPQAPTFDLSKDFGEPHWIPAIEVPERNKVFIRRLLEDFNHQWRHILRNNYNDTTFRQLCNAVLRIVTLDFKVVEINQERQGFAGASVGPLTLPSWEALDPAVQRIGRVWVVTAQNPADALSRIRDHAASRQVESSDRESVSEYLILSVRHVVLCTYEQDTLKWTSPQPLLDGVNTSSDMAIKYLIYATFCPQTTPRVLQGLPIEIQDRIRTYFSEGGVEGARLGCLLGLGSPFLWMDGQFKIQREEVLHRSRTISSFVESQIWFTNKRSGLAYKARTW